MARALGREVSSFDVVHLHSVFLWPTLAAARASARAGVPYVLSPRGMLVRSLIAARGRRRKTLWLALFERDTVRRAAAVIVSSELERQELAALELDLAPVEVIPNGLSPEEPADDGSTAAAASAGQPPFDRQPLVVYLGRLSWKKGVDLALAALAQLPGAHLAVAGNDDEGLRPRLEGLAGELGVADRVSFLGEVRGGAKTALLAAARALVLPSMSENFGMAALEAMAAGVPVVLTPGVGLAEAVREHGAGIVCERTPASLAAALASLLADPTSAAAMGARGRDLAATHYSWPAIAAATRRSYERAIAAAVADRSHALLGPHS